MPVEGVAGFSIAEGKEIAVQPYPDMEPDVMRLFLQGRAMSALLQQRLVPVLHGSSVATPSGAVIFAGLSGCGKSPLAAVFRRRGFRVLTDDVAAVEGSLVLPGPACLMLWEDSLRLLDIDLSEVRPNRAGSRKHILTLGSAYQPEPVHLRKIYIVQDSEQTSLAPVRGMEKFDLLMSNLFCADLSARMGIEAEYLARVAELAAQTEVAILARNPAPNRLDETVDFVQRDLSSGVSARC